MTWLNRSGMRQAGGSHLTRSRHYRLGQDSDKRRALAAGFDQHLTKPIDPVKLSALVEAQQRRSSGSLVRIIPDVFRGDNHQEN